MKKLLILSMVLTVSLISFSYAKSATGIGGKGVTKDGIHFIYVHDSGETDVNGDTVYELRVRDSQSAGTFTAIVEGNDTMITLTQDVINNLSWGDSYTVTDTSFNSFLGLDVWDTKIVESYDKITTYYAERDQYGNIIKKVRVSQITKE
jgi:hypothetical protein